jgi:hypothetical protein
LNISSLKPLWPLYADFLYWRRRAFEAKLDGLRLSPEVFRNSVIDWADWEIDYVPSGGLAGKTVLDIGCGEGESMAFFFEKGAAKVIGIECDWKKVSLCRENIARQGWNATVIHESFDGYSRWEFIHDFLKIDVEGAESILLEDRSFPPHAAVEIHGRRLFDQFRAKWPSLSYRKLRMLSDLWMAKSQ